MLLALAPRPREAKPGTPGRPSQDPATIHCLKVLLCLLLRDQHDITVQEIQELLQLNAGESGKKVMDVLSGKIDDSLPPFARLSNCPDRGTGRKRH
jgi:hypothetical protein